MSLLLLRDTSIILGINLFGQIQKIVFELRRVVKYFIKLQSNQKCIVITKKLVHIFYKLTFSSYHILNIHFNVFWYFFLF